MRLIEHLIRPDDCVWDVGAHHGYVTLCAARCVRTPEQVHAFEPSAVNHAMLRRHLSWNALHGVQVHRVALSDFDGTARFGGQGSSQTFALDRGPELVEVRRGGSMIAAGAAPAPTFVKVDVEGAEAGVLRGLIDQLPPAARLLIAMHSAAAVEECGQLLTARGFRPIGTMNLYLALVSAFHDDPDLLALGPACRVLSSTAIATGELVIVGELP